jgi:hypothetical protein
MSESRKVRWGILSTANIGVHKVIPAILKSPHSEVVAIASRDLGRAHTAIAHLGLRSHARAYGSYEELFADPNVDAIYNPLPNHLHVPMTLAATQAGKHVLCEKPIGLNAARNGNAPARSPAPANWVNCAPSAPPSATTMTTPAMSATRPISAAAASWISAATRSPPPATSSKANRSASSR